MEISEDCITSTCHAISSCCNLPSSPSFHPITTLTSSTSVQLSGKDLSDHGFVECSMASGNILERSISSMDTSFNSITDINLNDSSSDIKGVPNTSTSFNKVKKKAGSNKKFKDELDTKRTGKQIKNNTILNYFSRTNSPNKKKPTMRKSENIKSSEVKKKCTSKKSPLFDLPVSPRLHLNTKAKNIASNLKEKKLQKTNKKEQMYIDIGQKGFGHVICPTCGMVYTKSQEEDEAQHAKFHQKISSKLHFNGWKNERVVQEFHDGRIIMIHGSDHAFHLRKLAEVKEVVDAELGFASAQNLYSLSEQQAFLFVMSKRIVGCAIAISITKAYPVIPQTDTTNSENDNGEPSSSWCCSTDPVSALCGISRIWVFSQNRRQGIASRLVDCIRYHFLYGYVITKEKIAFSDPTPNGRAFAEKYTGKSAILVFR